MTQFQPGLYKTTLGEKNNNPGNLRYVESILWLGLDEPPSDGKYCRFVTPALGIRALCKDVLSKWYRGLRTVRTIIEVYAPPNENNTGAYINDLCARLAVAPDDPLDLTNNGVLSAFARGIIWHENGKVIYPSGLIAQGATMALSPPDG